MIIYEITMVERYEVLEGISKSNKKTLVVLVNQTMEKIEFCFFNADDLKTKEISSISNTFLKLDDNFLVPVVFKEDFILTGHSSTLEQIKCNFYYLR